MKQRSLTAAAIFAALVPTDRLRRDEALSRALRSLEARLETAREDCGPPMDFHDTPRAARRTVRDWSAVDLDEVARRHGYSP